MFKFFKKIKNNAQDERVKEELEVLSNRLEANGDMNIIESFAKQNQIIKTTDLGIMFEPKEHKNNDDEYSEITDYGAVSKNDKQSVGSSSKAINTKFGYIAKKIRCQLDDLTTLLTNSEKYNNALAQIENSGELYEDPTFLPNLKSLVGFSINFEERDKMEEYTFKRSHEYFGENAKIHDDLCSEDIEQGDLKDCYFLAAISSIAEHPDRLKRLFLTRENKNNGLFAVALCINGVWEEVILDDYAPCKLIGDKWELAFNSSKSDEMWVVLLEKAWAKIHGGYLNINNGFNEEALRDLTGASTECFYRLQEKKEIDVWNKLMEADEKHYIMAASTQNLNYGSDSYIKEIGLCGSHAYSLLAVYQLFFDGKTYKKVDQGEEYTHRVLKLRNPWGKDEWKGQWEDADPNWTPELKNELEFIGQSEDGTFFMPWEDFLKYFEDVQICYYHDGYKYSAQKFKTKKDDIIFLKFTLNKEGEYYFSINQKNQRFFPQHLKYKYSSISWVLGKVNGEEVEFVANGNNPGKESWGKAACEPGEYYVMINTPWISCSDEFSFSVYGPGMTTLEKIEEQNLPKNFINQIFIDDAKDKIKIKGRNFAVDGHPGIKHVSSEKNGWAYLYIQNDEEDHQISVNLNLGNEGVRVMPPHFGYKPAMIVKPGCSDIVVYKSFGNQAVNVKMTHSFRKVDKIDLIKEQVKTSKIISKQYFNGEQVDIKIYFYKHASGLALLCVNNTDDLTLMVKFIFELENAHIEGVEGNTTQLSVTPKKDYLIKVVPDDNEKPFKVRLVRKINRVTKSTSLYNDN
jgi:calpain-15